MPYGSPTALSRDLELISQGIVEALIENRLDVDYSCLKSRHNIDEG
jgi:hypothetical protein